MSEADLNHVVCRNRLTTIFRTVRSLDDPSYH
jgi:hypothetical protein